MFLSYSTMQYCVYTGPSTKYKYMLLMAYGPYVLRTLVESRGPRNVHVHSERGAPPQELSRLMLPLSDETRSLGEHYIPRSGIST